MLTALRSGTAMLKEAFAKGASTVTDMSELGMLEGYFARLETLNMDLVECGALKALVLLNPGMLANYASCAFASSHHLCVIMGIKDAV